MTRANPAFLLALAAPLALAGALSACMATDSQTAAGRAAGPQSTRQCFLPRQVNSFDAVDRDTVNVTVGVREIYQLEILGTCPDIDWSTRIGIRSTHGASWVCQGMDAELIVPGPTGLDRCPVTSVRKLSDAEVEALHPRRR
jgi:hypothetical protein